MKKIILLFFILIISTNNSFAETLICKQLQGVMTTSNKKSFSEIKGQKELLLDILKNKVIVSNDSDKIEYKIEKNDNDIIHFYNITPYVFDIFSYYKKNGVLYYSKHSNLITNYASLYKTTCTTKIN